MIFGTRKTSAAHEAARFIRSADKARDEKRYLSSAALYEEAIRYSPGRPHLHLIAGHMYKEAKRFEEAETHYFAAVALDPLDPEIAFQLGHYYKTLNRSDKALIWYQKAQALSPQWASPAAELRRLAKFGDPIEHLVPEIVPALAEDMLLEHAESIHLRRVGHHDRTRWGELPVLRGVCAIRGFCIAADQALTIELLLGDVLLHRGDLEAHFLPRERFRPELRKHVFNIWLDVSHQPPGLSSLTVRFPGADGQAELKLGERLRIERVVVAAPLAEAEGEASDNYVPPLDVEDRRSVRAQVNALPSVVRSARRSLLPVPPKTILVLRTDQLGDVVASIPAMRRLRTLVPDARLIGLLTAANAELARSMKLFDEIIIVDYPDDPEQRRRVMNLDAQAALKTKLASYHFDVAIDLAPSSESRPLLLLSGAPIRIGMGDFPWLTVKFGIQSRDRLNDADVIPHSIKPLALIESFGAMLGYKATVHVRDNLPRSLLEPFGVSSASFVVLHLGARIAFSRWPHYGALARELLARTGLTILILSDSADQSATISPETLRSDRVRLIERRLEFDQLDALLSYASLFVGNDSGPKHLAALRGTPVASIHSARINWGEWGQELSGKIISRRVPCAGCLIYHEPDECGAGYACVREIAVDEVLAVALDLLGGGRAEAESTPAGADPSPSIR